MSEYEKQIERIKLKLQLAKAKDKELKVFGSNRHGYVIKKPTSIKEVRAFEEKYCIDLPSCYKAFITQVGNGGTSYMNSAAGPYFGIFPLGESIHELVDEPEKYLSGNCVLTPEMTDEFWNDLNRRIEEDENISDEEYDKEKGKIFGGILPIGSQGCTYLHGIVLNGEYKGRVVNLDMDWQKPKFTYEENFLDWYERWLDEVILGHLLEPASWFGYSERSCEILEVSEMDVKPKRRFKFWR